MCRRQSAAIVVDAVAVAVVVTVAIAVDSLANAIHILAMA